MTDVRFRIPESELFYEKKVHDAIEHEIAEEVRLSGGRRSDIIDQRKYFVDYFAELKEDERRDLLGSEFLDTKDYLSRIAHIKRLNRQLQRPYFAGMDVCYDDEPEEEQRMYLSLQTLRDPETGDILTYDWRAPVASLYYESEPGHAFYNAPSGKQYVQLKEKRRYVFKNGRLSRISSVNMPSDDEILADALKQNAGEHMKIIVETLQKEQNRIVRDHIDGVTVISGCAGSGKTSVALHKAAYILYGFRDKMKDSSLAVISPNDAFSEYISTVLPDLGEDNILMYIQEDILDEVLETIGDRMPYRTRLEEAETAGEFGLSEITDEAVRMTRCRALKSSEEFRELLLKYYDFLNRRIFVPEDMTLTDEGEGLVTADELHEMFYVTYTDVPLLKRIGEIGEAVCRANRLTSEANRENVLNALRSMMRGLSAGELYRRMFYDGDFLAECGADPEPYLEFTDMFEDACAVAVLHVMLNEPEFENTCFYLICDEAQDLSPVFLELLRLRYPGRNMLFVGDSDQAVFGNLGDFTQRIRSIIRRRPFKHFSLDTNYRSTREIVDFSSKILGKPEGSVRSVRSGAVPEIVKFPTEGAENGAARIIVRLVERAAGEGYESFAVITRNRLQAEALEKAVAGIRQFTDIRLSFMPVYLSKGLEFDNAAVFDYKDPYYSTEEGRLALYTACTRALHMLYLLDGEA